MKNGGVPLTLVLVLFLYLGGEVSDAVTQRDNISQMAHIAGGAVGSVLGFLLSKTRKKDHF